MYNHSNNKPKVTTGSNLSPDSRIENNPAFGLSNQINQLHKTIGNRAVGKMLQRAAITNQVSSNPAAASIIQRVYLHQAGREIRDDLVTYKKELGLARMQRRQDDVSTITEAQKSFSFSSATTAVPTSSSSSSSAPPMTAPTTVPLTESSSSSSSSSAPPMTAPTTVPLTESSSSSSSSSAPMTAPSTVPLAESSSSSSRAPSSSSSSSTRELVPVELASPAHWTHEVPQKFRSIAKHKYGWSFADIDKQERDLKLINDFIVKKENNGVSFNNTDFLPKVQYTVNDNTYSTHKKTSQLYPMHGPDIINGIGPLALGQAMEQMGILTTSNAITLYQIYCEIEKEKAEAEAKAESKEGAKPKPKSKENKRPGVKQLSKTKVREFVRAFEKLAGVKVNG
ncbi:MAG: hypothetical protein K0Q73_6743 [Paenibacillus sp.]|jgi:hypothetical protein|nr:hypothetical protein [Paenibacillus sp.]